MKSDRILEYLGLRESRPRRVVRSLISVAVLFSASLIGYLSFGLLGLVGGAALGTAIVAIITWREE